MLAMVASLDGTRSVRRSMSGPSSDPEDLGRRLAAALAAEGARELLDEQDLTRELAASGRAHDEHDDDGRRRDSS